MTGKSKVFMQSWFFIIMAILEGWPLIRVAIYRGTNMILNIAFSNARILKGTSTDHTISNGQSYCCFRCVAYD